MSAPYRGLRGAILIAGAITFASATVMADVTKDECIDANGKAQDLRREGKFAAAREELHTCADPSCPAIVRDDCTKRLDDLEKAQPTIAFEVKDSSGLDASAVRIAMDGKELAGRPEGTAFPVDVGEHVFRFEVAGQPPVTRTLVITEGEKDRRERIVIGPAVMSPKRISAIQPPAAAPSASNDASPLATATTSGPASTELGSRGMGTQKVLGLTAAGSGVFGIVIGSVFGALALSEKSKQESVCGSSCTPADHAQAVSDHSTGMTDSTIATVGFIAGGALLASGIVLFVTGGHEHGRLESRVWLVPSGGPGVDGMSIRGVF